LSRNLDLAAEEVVIEKSRRELAAMVVTDSPEPQ
jgi:hypothetical protein